MKLLSTFVLAGAIALLGTTAATAAPAATTFQIPVVTGPEFGSGGVPGGVFQTVAPVAVTGEQPGTVTFGFPALRQHHYQFEYRFVAVSWRNLATGATGVVNLRHWETLPNGNQTFPASLPTSATVVTGAGPVVATAAHLRTQYQAPPMSNAVVPGLGVLQVP